MTYKAGQLVVNRKLGLGKVLEVRGDIVMVYFRDELENPRAINVEVVPMTLAPDQSDASLDDMTMLTRNKKAAARKKKPKAQAAVAVPA